MSTRDGESGTRARDRSRHSFSTRYRALIFRLKSRPNAFFIVVAVGVGVLGGFGAIAFRMAIESVQELCWPDGRGTVARVSAAAPWLRVLVPTAGGLAVGLLVRYFAREAKGHGVPEVMEAVAVRGGRIRPRVSMAKLVGSAITIGTGGSAGREGPIIQIGAAIGSAVGQFVRVSSGRMKTFVACGAAAGMAATFNAPIAGALFAGEIILGSFSAAAFGPIVIASVVGTAISRSILGNNPTFDIPLHYDLESPWELLGYAVLGAVAAGVGLLFVTVLHRTERGFDRLSGVPSWAKPAIGGLVIGLVALVLPQAMGIGYDLMEPALLGRLAGLTMVGYLVLKLLATSITLGSGGSGGVFAPSLLLGSMAGGAVGSLMGAVLPQGLAASPGAYALVGMGAVVASTTHAPITAIVIMFELTGNYEIILPLMIACISGALLAMHVRRDSIYTIRLSARGRQILFGSEVNVLRSIGVVSVMRKDRMECVRESTPLKELIGLMIRSPQSYFYVLDEEDRLTGVLSVHDLRKILDDVEHLSPILVAADVARTNLIAVGENDTLDVAMRHFGRESVESLPVVSSGDPRRLVGTIERQDVVATYNREMFRRDMAGELAGEMSRLPRSRVVHVVDGFGLLEVEAPVEFVGTSLGALDVRARHGVEVLLIWRPAAGDGPGETIMASAQTRIMSGDRLLLFGRRERLETFLRL